jgi:predicted SprT family Zn-dependent metalloprotease
VAEPDLDWVIATLYVHYENVNRDKFGGALPDGFSIVFNPRLRRLTGRITYSARLIEISWFHFQKYGFADAKATLEHEMLHLYLHVLGLPSGHNAAFKREARRLDIRVYHANEYRRNVLAPTRYLYQCPHCSRMVFRKRPLRGALLACGPCCREIAGGAFDARFALAFVQKIRMA